MSLSLSRRAFLRRSAGALSLFGAAGLAAHAQPVQGATTAAPKPNILVLLADDHAFDLIGALGHSEVQTPHLDRLVRRGVRFTNCYSQGGWHGAICVASRTMLLTGRFLWDARDADRRMDAEAAAGRLWPQYLAEAGYRTYMSGKWHVNCDAAAVFQVARNIRPGMPPDIAEQYDRPQDGQADPFDPADPALGGFYAGGRHWTDVLGDDGVNFIQDAAGHPDPFFMYLCFNAPHDPRQSPRAYLDRYPVETIAVPRNFLPEYPDKDAIGCDAALRDERLAPFPRTEHAVRTHRAEYYAIISHMDTQVGRILDALESSGCMENTVIIFTSDHGLAVGHHGFMGKQNMYEHSMKAPLLLAGPNFPVDRQIDALVYVQDIMPTTLELAGLATPEHVAYHSLLPLITGEQAATHKAVYGAYMDHQRMIRVGTHKLIQYPALDKALLFDLEADPYEKNNLAVLPEYQPLLNQLQTRLHTLQHTLGDPLL